MRPWTLAALAAALLAGGNRLGVLLLAALLGYSVQALESQDCWDYALDPIFWIWSLGAVGTGIVREAARWVLGKREGRARRGEEQPVPAGAE